MSETYSLNRWIFDTREPFPGEEMPVSGHNFLLYPVGEWGDRAWINREVDIYVTAETPFHTWIGGQKLVFSEIPRSAAHAARMAIGRLATVR